jgi:hypothetical protein
MTILCVQMRRLVVMFASLAALAVPAAGSSAGSSDGTLVVKNGVAPAGLPVVQLTITGSVIGKVGHGRIVIDAALGSPAPQVTDYESTAPSTKIDTAQIWRGQDFTFRAVGGKYTILVYGSDVNLVAVGKGSVRLTGLPDTPLGDGKYSLSGDDFVSLPGTQTDKLTLGNG